MPMKRYKPVRSSGSMGDATPINSARHSRCGTCERACRLYCTWLVMGTPFLRKKDARTLTGVLPLLIPS